MTDRHVHIPDVDHVLTHNLNATPTDELRDEVAIDLAGRGDGSIDEATIRDVLKQLDPSAAPTRFEAAARLALLGRWMIESGAEIRDGKA